MLLLPLHQCCRLGRLHQHLLFSIGSAGLQFWSLALVYPVQLHFAPHLDSQAPASFWWRLCLRWHYLDRNACPQYCLWRQALWPYLSMPRWSSQLQPYYLRCELHLFLSPDYLAFFASSLRMFGLLFYLWKFYLKFYFFI